MVALLPEEVPAAVGAVRRLTIRQIEMEGIEGGYNGVPVCRRFDRWTAFE